ncbi:adenine deaminase [Roseomonas xinghualingensis]|uniref:adenine deaminase n=1 Tax=Roseomonas xinghualingensis TaxID=2986475 RepID=UPI00298E5775|nr:adenine deaminase C-terminal domain-containing protein [Roseomonas sp. SXEYE001]
MDAPIPAGTRRAAIRAAKGEAPFDLLLTGGTVVDVALGELRPADIGVVGGLIASVHRPGSRSDAVEVHDVTGRFLSPGFVDSHLHFESSFMAPADYASTVVPHGTLTTVWDPHELANVLGVPGVRWAVEQSRGLPLRVLVAAPSCVPSAPGLEMAGAEIGPEEMTEMLSWPEVSGIAEVMDMAGVLSGSARMEGIVAAGMASGKNVNGHARDLIGPALQAYAAAGVTSDHEIMGPEDFLQKLRAGLTVELRGSHDAVLPGVVAAINALPALPPNLVTCTDDVFPDELVEKGGLRDTLARLVAHGLPPIHALKMATLHAALRLKRDDIGLLGPGRRAEIVVLSDLPGMVVERVYVSGKLVARDGTMLAPLPRGFAADAPRDTMRIPPQPARAFALRPHGITNGKVRLPVVGGARVVHWAEVEVEVRDSVAAVPPGHALIAILHRHGRRDPSPVICLADGWGEPRGAVATTISHDNHNLLVIGREPEDMAAAANALIACGGGMSVARAGVVEAVLPLPVAGLLAETPPHETAAAFARLREAAGAVMDWKPPFRVFRGITGISLACNPGPHPTDLGIADAALGTVRDPAMPLPAMASE